MANIKSAKKRIKVIETKTLRNRMIKSALKTSMKKSLAAVASGNIEEAKAEYKATAKALDMAASKGVLHRNKAARAKSKLAVRVNALNA
ncbi:30S ribosomal protein S20 [Clostridium liquoris]|jgi:small subunit ribosomal protein S20|uniref:Small ribosomal subunit protein bS20 n=1 Tax=Clostridium liquoris TaxID=1289519 RepID=A0A2T0B1C7_9CLOT|nr:30S ribosomal protein S20 [Clostridium liquoris]PRR77257.1 30S ribosomal protein S20 [Clostridium liquoris]